MIDRRTLLGGAACLAAGLGLAGCGRDVEGPAKGADAVPLSWAVCRIGAPHAIDPMLVTDRAGIQVLRALFCPLTRVADGKAEPFAAQRVEMSDDARTFTFHLPDGATFHNGERVTASSFKRAWERLVRPLPEPSDEDGASKGDKESKSQHSRWCDLLAPVEGYEALHGGRASELVGLRCPDDLTFVVELTEPDVTFALVAAHPALGPVPEGAHDDPEAYVAKPVGNGPFKLQETWEGKGDIRLERFDACAPVLALADGVLLNVQKDTAAAYRQFQAGNVDICDVPVEQYEDAEELAGASTDATAMRPTERLAHGPEAGVAYLVCNLEQAPFDRREFRTALSHAIDREALCRKALNFYYEPAHCPISPCVGEAAPWKACAFDAEQASAIIEELLAMEQEAYAKEVEEGDESASSGSASGSAASASAGAEGAEAKGAYADVEGADAEEADADAEVAAPLTIEDLGFTVLHRKGGIQGRIASHIAQDVQDVGIAVKTEALATEDLLERLDTGDFACALMTFDPKLPAPECVVSGLFGRDAAPMRWSGAAADDELADAVEGLTFVTDAAERAEHVTEALALAGESLALIPLAHPAYTKVAADRVASARVCPDGSLDLASVELV